VEERVSYSCKADIWSYGAIIYELLTDKQFVDKPKGMDTKKNFREAIENMVYSQECASLSKAENTFWRALLKGTLEYEPGKRWSAREVYHHIASFHKYQSIGPMDFVAIVKFKEAKDQIMRHLPALEPFFRRTRFMRQTFSLYAKFLEQGVDFLIRKRV
jgi:serine/threonine protein kinase